MKCLVFFHPPDMDSTMDWHMASFLQRALGSSPVTTRPKGVDKYIITHIHALTTQNSRFDVALRARMARTHSAVTYSTGKHLRQSNTWMNERNNNPTRTASGHDATTITAAARTRVVVVVVVPQESTATAG